jgi:hypothetical protein
VGLPERRDAGRLTVAGPDGGSLAGGLIFKIFTDLGVDTAAGDGKLDGLPRRGSGRIFDGVCPFLENSTVC